MQGRGHEFLITAREKEVSHQLLNSFKISFYDRGKGSNNIFGKILYVLKADRTIYKISKIHKPDLFLSFASPYAGHVASLLGKSHISFTDTENAKLGIISFSPFADCILTPDSFRGKFGEKHVSFKGFMELCYLHPKYFSSEESILSELGLAEKERYALLRFVSWNANHDIGQSGIPYNYKMDLVKRISRRMRVFISSEGHLPDELLDYKINISPEKIHHVLAFASLYLGEGATMASESAMLGTPAVYINSISAGTIEKQQSYGLLYSYRNINGVFDKLEELLNNPFLKNTFERNRVIMLKDQIDVNSFMVWFIENYPDSVRILKKDPSYQERFK